MTEENIQQSMRGILQRIATGPELSKDISRDEAALGTRAVLEGRVDPVQAGIFFIALRMKRETMDENKGVLDAIRAATHSVTAPVDEVVDIADPYDGYNRTLPTSPFLPALLAELGAPAVSHGVASLGPKYGVTHRQVLAAAGVPVDLEPSAAAARLGDPALGWSYVDQARFCPQLHDLVALRTLIVKRPALTTVEVLAGPVRGRSRTHFVTGYVHKPYPPIYAELARTAGFDSALLIRGVEGGVVPSLRQPGRCFAYHDRGAETGFDIDPATLGIDQVNRAAPLPESLTTGEAADVDRTLDTAAIAAESARQGLAALSGERGPVYDSLLYAAALVLHHLGRTDSLADAGDRVRSVLDAGRAAQRLR